MEEQNALDNARKTALPQAEVNSIALTPGHIGEEHTHTHAHAERALEQHHGTRLTTQTVHPTPLHPNVEI